jgi:hypothetical protein
VHCGGFGVDIIQHGFKLFPGELYLLFPLDHLYVENFAADLDAVGKIPSALQAGFGVCGA